MKILLSLMASATLYAAPQAVVFDFGGVMTGEPNREAVIQFLAASLHLSDAEFEKAYVAKKEAVKSGSTDEEFWVGFAKQHKIALPRNWTHDFKTVMKDAIGVNLTMYTLVDELREKQIPVALLSNIDERLSKLVREFKLYEPFDPCLLSCEIGIEKPDSKAYQILMEKLNLPAEEIVFIDDKTENIEAAKKLGIDAILFESADQIRSELIKRGFLTTEKLRT